MSAVAHNEWLKGQKTALYLNGYYSSTGEASPGIREANGRKNLYENAPVYVEPLVVPPQAPIVGNLNAAIANEIATNIVGAHELHQDRLDIYLTQDGTDTKTTLEQCRNFKHICLGELRFIHASAEERLVEESGAALAQWYNGHFGYDFGYVLERGLENIMKEIQKLGAHSSRPEFYTALGITVEGMQRYIYRHKLYADSLLEGEGTGQFSREYLQTVSGVCGNIAYHKPADFHEAVQLQWFLMMFSDYDSFARYDQYMLPFYENDTGVSKEEAKNIFKAMLQRANECSILNMTIGGLTPDGEDAVNDLTYLIMESVRELKLKCPNLCLRVSRFDTPRLWKEIGINLSTGQALPALYNDDVFIPMLGKAGIHQNDANNYTLAGCSQAVIPGKSNFNCDVGLYVPAKMLELALHNGLDPRTKKQTGPQTGDPVFFQTYDDLYRAYRDQMMYCVAKGASLNNQDVRARKGMLSCVRTILMPECMHKGIGILEGGSTYNGIQSEVIGLTNTANSLMAVKTLVYDEQKITMEQLLQALNADFNGFEDVHAMLLGAPKFGNNHREADSIRYEITRDIYAQLSSHAAELGGFHWPGEVIFSYHVSQGYYVGALPDGRHAYTPLADSAGPSQGTDTKGVTAMLLSAAGLPFDMPCTSINVNVKFAMNLWQEQKDKIITVFQSYFYMGGGQLQINVLDARALRDALEHPMEHKSLVVRVGGFSAYFVELPRDVQLEIISRTEIAA